MDRWLLGSFCSSLFILIYPYQPYQPYHRRINIEESISYGDGTGDRAKLHLYHRTKENPAQGRAGGGKGVGSLDPLQVLKTLAELTHAGVVERLLMRQWLPGFVSHAPSKTSQ